MTTLTAIEKASLKVFGIPELTYLICSITQKRDNASLMRVCRQFFHQILPFVWEEVDEADPLVSMIPGCGVFTYDTDLVPYMVMKLPRSLELSRFNIYAPYVKRLTPSALNVDKYDGWEEFLSCTRSIDLLPNLETLHLPILGYDRYTSNPSQIQIDGINWITAFLSTSLRTLALVPPDATYSVQRVHWLEFDLTNDLMGAVSQRCPHLCSLNIFPEEARTGGSQHWNTFSQQGPLSDDSLQIHSYLLSLTNLSYLSISVVGLGAKALVAIAGLPHLESLRISGLEYNRKVYYDDLEISVGAFPALKKLELERITWDTIVNLCKSKPTVAGLRSISILHPHWPDTSDSDYFNKIYMGLSDVINSLAANKSSITALSVHHYWNQVVSPDALESLKCLSLTDLNLGWEVRPDGGLETLHSFLSRTPLLEKLRLDMTQTPFDLQKLKTIIGLLPRLRHIRIPVNWSSITALEDIYFIPSRSQNTNPLCLRSDYYLPHPEQESAERLARFLSAIRPESSIVCEAHQPAFYCYDIDEYVDETPKDMINAELSRVKLG